MVEDARVPWREVTPLDPVNGDLTGVLANVDTLRVAWDDALARMGPGEFTEARRRSLRRHAIETGIIERLYDVEWGVTEALVAEGLTVDAAVRGGGLEDDVLAVISSQYDALTFLAEYAREGTDLSIGFIRQLHAAICGWQLTYEARDALGQVRQVALEHGGWKKHPNHVRRPDGSLLEYAPPEHVQWQMERLLDYYKASQDVHPVIRAAWLHHRFICIHPFADGNGRVARALTLLVLLRGNYAPLVVDRRIRGDYLAALDLANTGDLRGLVRLFARCEINALRSELEGPARPEPAAAGAVDVARSYVERLRALQETSDKEKAAQAEALASRLQDRVKSNLQSVGEALRDQFAVLDPRARFTVDTSAPGEEKAGWWRRQILHAANQADFFVSLAQGTWWAHLRLKVFGQTLRYVVVIQKVGHGETGVLALTVFAEILSASDGSGEPTVQPLTALEHAAADTGFFDNATTGAIGVALEFTEADSVTLVYSDDVDTRWEDVSGLIDRTLAVAVARFAQGLG